MGFPTTLDTFPDAATLAAQTLATTPHSTLHANLGAALRALEEKVGIDGSADTDCLDYLIAQLTTAVAARLVAANNLSDLANLCRRAATSL